MTNLKNASIVPLLLALGLPSAQAQAPKVSGLAQVWYSQMTENNLRKNNNSLSYFNMPGAFRENGLSIRRIDIKVAGSIGENLDYEIMIDPSINNNGNNANIVLQDAVIKYKLPNKIELKVGQFKNLQTLEGLASSSAILLAERAMLVRVFGDVRDRGVAASMGFGDPNAFGGRFHVGALNGSGKINDSNPQKDLVARLDMNYGKLHTFGAYTLQGSTSQADIGGLYPGIFPNQPVGFDSTILDNKDKTSNMGAFYRFQNEKFHASAEAITGLLGRRNPSLFTASGQWAGREHLDQKFFGYVGTVAYTIKNHTFVARYDAMDYNSGSDWYGTTDPYKRTITLGAGPAAYTTNVDYSPQYTEITFGYVYALNPEKFGAANIKVNYIMRSKNFLAPRLGQQGEQGGDTLVVCFQAAF
jgi:hypothetical protein